MNIIGYFTTPIKVVEGEMSCMQDISSYALDVKEFYLRQRAAHHWLLLG